MRHFTGLVLPFIIYSILLSCSANRQLRRYTHTSLLRDSALLNAHTGISLYDPATGRYLYSFQGSSYFIPASNAKLFTCYAGMKYLSDSLPGMLYRKTDTALLLIPTGDPTLLHPEFKQQPVMNFLKQQNLPLYITANNWRDEALGFGWAWDDYNDNYMVERSPLPVYGNTATYRLQELYDWQGHTAKAKWAVTPAFFTNTVDSQLALPVKAAAQVVMQDTAVLHKALGRFSLLRQRTGNRIGIRHGSRKFTAAEIPFYTDTLNTALAVLAAELPRPVKKGWTGMDESLTGEIAADRMQHLIKSQPTDSLLAPMMHRSDNFYAEQTLLMVSNQLLGYMNAAAIVDTLLKTDLKDLPQRPKWVDGSGLSRYNLFTPNSLVQLLAKMKAEFGLERLKTILPTGGEGTLGSYYQNLQGKIFAKTGTLSNNCALSGFLITKSGKLLIFSILANHYPTGATPVRRAVEKWLNEVYSRF